MSFLSAFTHPSGGGALRALKPEPLVYVLRLLYIDGYFVGFVSHGSRYSQRLTAHILGDACSVTREFGVSAVDHVESAKDIPKATDRVEAIVSHLHAAGRLAWGGSHLTHSKLAAYRAWLTPVAAKDACQRQPLPVLDAEGTPF